MDYWVEKLHLQEHPEGGFFKETYRAHEQADAAALPDRFSGSRSFSTAIYFLIPGVSFSAFHRIKSDEIWHFHTGSTLTIHFISPDGSYSKLLLGDNPDEGEFFQAVVPAGYWFAATVNNQDSFSLVGCTVSPGFDFTDFELGNRDNLTELFPQHKGIIAQLTR
ncbi:MAG: cupin domain-containing protein [bacterium]|nr:cupin domain-containing protein [bacterium]